MDADYRNPGIYVPGFIKVLKCYESTIDAYVERCKKEGVEPNSFGDDIFRNQMNTCRQLHMNWTLIFRPMTGYDIDLVNGLSTVLTRLVQEKLDSISAYDTVY